MNIYLEFERLLREQLVAQPILIHNAIAKSDSNAVYPFCLSIEHETSKAGDVINTHIVLTHTLSKNSLFEIDTRANYHKYTSFNRYLTPCDMAQYKFRRNWCLEHSLSFQVEYAKYAQLTIDKIIEQLMIR